MCRPINFFSWILIMMEMTRSYLQLLSYLVLLHCRIFSAQLFVSLSLLRIARMRDPLYTALVPRPACMFHSGMYREKISWISFRKGERTFSCVSHQPAASGYGISSNTHDDKGDSSLRPHTLYEWWKWMDPKTHAVSAWLTCCCCSTSKLWLNILMLITDVSEIRR